MTAPPRCGKPLRRLNPRFRPAELQKNEPLVWSAGTGVEVWNLFCNVTTGDLDAVQTAMRANPALVRCHYNYRTPLYFAVRENRVAIASFLLDNGALLESNLSLMQHASPDGEPVAAAIRDRNIGLVRTLLRQAPHLLHAGDRTSNQPIHWATMTRQLDLIDELLALGADINARRFDGARPIHLYNGDYNYRGWRDVPKDIATTPREVLDHLVSRGAEVDLNTAAHIGNLERVRELLDADPSRANRVSDYVTYYIGAGAPLRNAAAKGHIEIVRLLLERGADPNLPEEGIAPKGHALYSAVYNGHHEVAKLLLEHGAYPSPPVESSADALSIAIMNEDEAMVELLVSYGSARSVELLAHYGDTQTAAAVFAANPALADDPGAFGSAVGQGRESFVRLMLRYQPDLAARFMPCAAKSQELNEFLFERGMNPNQRDWLGATPLHEFARKGDVERAALFLDHGADIDARDEDLLSTPLAWAAKFGKREMVEFLLGRGAKTNLPDDPAWATPLAWATRRGHTEIREVLERAGAK